jgi:hypothetical protein
LALDNAWKEKPKPIRQRAIARKISYFQVLFFDSPHPVVYNDME